MKPILLLIIFIFAMGNTIAQSDTLFIDTGNGTAPKLYLISEIDSITFVVKTTVGIEEEITQNITPSKFSISQNYPNPFNPSTTVSFKLNSCSKRFYIVWKFLKKRAVFDFKSWFHYIRS